MGKQVCAQKTGQGLNKLFIQTDVQKKFHWDPEVPAILSRCEDGAYVFGFQLEGAAWDKNSGKVDESIPKQQFSVVPLIYCTAKMIVEGKEEKGIYKCPVYIPPTETSRMCSPHSSRPPTPPRSGYLLVALSSSMSRASPMPSSPDRSLQMRAKPPKSENTTDSQTLYIYHNFN